MSLRFQYGLDLKAMVWSRRRQMRRSAEHDLPPGRHAILPGRSVAHNCALPALALKTRTFYAGENFERQVAESLYPCVDGVDLPRKIPIDAGRALNEHDPRILLSVLRHDGRRPIGRPIIDDHPSVWPSALGDDRIERPGHDRGLIPRRRNDHIMH